MISIEGHVKEWVIAVALLILIPTTIYLGCDLLSPKIDTAKYYKARQEFFKGYDCKKREVCQKRREEWKQTDEFKEYQSLVCQQNLIYLAVAGPVSCALIIAGVLFVMPIVASGFIMTSLVLMTFYGNSYKDCTNTYGVELFWFELLFVLINLLFVLTASYKTSKKLI